MSTEPRCGALGPQPSTGQPLSCDLAFGHGGMHGADQWDAIPAGTLGVAPRAHWTGGITITRKQADLARTVIAWVGGEGKTPSQPIQLTDLLELIKALR